MVYFKNYNLCLNNRFKKDVIALQSLIPATMELYANNNFSLIQASAPSHGAKIVLNFLWEELISRYVAKTEWPPSSHDCNLLEYYFWNKVKEKVHFGHNAKHLECEKELQDRIFSVYDQCATNVESFCKARKHFLPHLKDIVTKERIPIKTVFG